MSTKWPTIMSSWKAIDTYLPSCGEYGSWSCRDVIRWKMALGDRVLALRHVASLADDFILAGVREWLTRFVGAVRSTVKAFGGLEDLERDSRT